MIIIFYKVHLLQRGTVQRQTSPTNISLSIKVKVRPRPGQESSEGQYKYNSISKLRATYGCVVNVTPRPLYPQERTVTLCIGVWVGPRTGLEGCGKTRHHRDSIPGPSSP